MKYTEEKFQAVEYNFPLSRHSAPVELGIYRSGKSSIYKKTIKKYNNKYLFERNTVYMCQ